MAKEVKKRAYSSALRQEQAAQTRRRVVEAAEALFVEAGYGSTSVRKVAERAGVAEDTVYATFGSKIRLLTAVIDARLAPEGETNVMDRTEADAVRRERDQRRQLELFARDVTNLLSKVGPIYEVLRTAGAVEPAAAAVYEEMNRYRLDNMRRVVGWLEAQGPLRVDSDRATETLWALASPDVARLLRHVRGWSDDDYTAWLADTLTQVLLDDPRPRSRRRRTG